MDADLRTFVIRPHGQMPMYFLLRRSLTTYCWRHSVVVARWSFGAFDLVRKSGVTYPLLADPQSSLQGAGPFPGRMGLPIFAFVDERGRATVVAGGVDSLAELEDLVDEHLGVRL